MVRLIAPGALIALFYGCGDNPTAPAADASSDSGFDTLGADLSPDGSPSCQAGTSDCVGNAVRRCEPGGQWGQPQTCLADTYCHDGKCSPPTEAQKIQAGALSNMIDHISGTIGWITDLSIDVPALKKTVQSTLYLGKGDTRDFYSTARVGLLGFPVGHLQMFSNTACGTDDFPYQEFSRLGACARPYQDHFIVTFARPNNPLALSAGDRITAVNGIRGQAMVDMALRLPTCGASSASPANRHMVAATSLLGAIPLGTQLEIVSPGGASRVVEVKTFASGLDWCRDPFGRSLDVVAATELRADGVGVVRLPRFTPVQGFKGQTMEEILLEIEQLKKDIAAELDKLKGAKAVVWDVRGNLGGATPVGLSIVGGMPGVKPVFIAHCKSRVPNSTPPVWYGGESQFDYQVTLDATFQQPAKVVVLIDGLSISAADYFAFAVAKATAVPLVGSATAGAFGGGGGATQISTGPDLWVQTDPARCADDLDAALEGRSVLPTHPVEYLPKDLAQGVDTLLEKAAQLAVQP